MVFSIWNDDPVAGLVDAVDAAIEPFVPQPSELVLRHDNLEDALGTAAGVVEAKLLIILDQFEEHFVYRSRQNGGEPFSDQVARCVNRGDLPVNFLISIREDSYAGVGDLFGGRITNVYSNSLHLRYLGKSDAREAIEKPIERLNETLPRDKWFSIDPPPGRGGTRQCATRHSEQEPPKTPSRGTSCRKPTTQTRSRRPISSS